MSIATSFPTSKQLFDLYADRARTLTPEIFGAAQQGRAIPIRLAYGYMDPDSFPTDALAAAHAEVLAEVPDVALNYGPPSLELLQQVARRLQQQGVTAEPDGILLSNGSSQILSLLPQVLVNSGDVVIIEGPSYMGAVGRFAQSGARLVTIPVDDQGMDVDLLEQNLIELAAQGIRPKFIYTIPTFQNPTGVTMSLERRQRLVALGAEYGVLIVEDDAYYDLRFSGEHLPTLAALDTEGWVLRVGTYSKILAPGVRIGWAYGPRDLLQRMGMFKFEGGNGPYVTHTVARFSADGRMEAHIQGLQKLYQQKYTVMRDAIAREFPADVVSVVPEGGFYIWCRLPSDISATALLEKSQASGVSFMPGTRCYADGRGDDGIRLAFSYHRAEQITEGIARIGEAMHALRVSGN